MDKFARTWQYFIFATLLAIAVLSLPGCSKSDAPPDTEVHSELEKHFRGLLTVSSSKLEKTGQEDNTRTYNISGSLMFTQGLYKEVAGMHGLHVYAPQVTRGDKMPFSASMKAMGDADTGWRINFSNLVTKEMPNGLLTEQEIEQRDYLRTDSADFKKTIQAKEAEYATSGEEAKRAQDDFERYPEKRKEMLAEIEKLEAEKQAALAKEKEQYNVWYKDFTSKNNRGVLYNKLSRERNQAIENFNKNSDVALETRRLSNLRSQVFFKKKIQKPDGSIWTLDEVDVLLKEANEKFKQEKKLKNDELAAIQSAGLDTYDGPLKEKKSAFETAIQKIRQDYDVEITRKKESFGTIDSVMGSYKRETEAKERNHQAFQKVRETLKKEGYL